MAWWWRYENRDGSAIAPKGTPSEEFPSQADAETWMGETWELLLTHGVTQVTLLENGREVYGPMGLEPAE